MAGGNENVEALELALVTVGRATVVVNGRSMLPFVFPGARLRVVPASERDVEVGDVVVVVRAGHAVVHRVVGREGNQVRTRGDAFRRPDEPVPGERVIARVPGFPLLRGTLRLPEALARPLGRVVAAHGTTLLERLFPALGVARTTLYRWRRRVPGLVERRGSELVIRTATRDDSAIVSTYFRRRGIAGGGVGETPEGDLDHRILLASRGERIVGGVSLLRDPERNTCLLYDLYVDPAVRGFGLGTRLVQAAVTEAARSFPDQRTLAEIRVANEASKTCFSRAGFELEAVSDDVETWGHGPGRVRP